MPISRDPRLREKGAQVSSKYKMHHMLHMIMYISLKRLQGLLKSAAYLVFTSMYFGSIPYSSVRNLGSSCVCLIPSSMLAQRRHLNRHHIACPRATVLKSDVASGRLLKADACRPCLHFEA